MASASNSGAQVAFKLVLLGEGRVGKTCLCLRYVQNTFSDTQEMTIQATYLDKRLNLGKQAVKLMIWDTAGQERFHALGPIYYRDAQGALLVYDITDRDSFGKVRHWVKELRTIVGESIALLIVGNKSDLERERQVNEAEAKEYADSVNATHLAVSAKTGKGVDAAFVQLTQRMMTTREQQQNANSAAGAAAADISGAGTGSGARKTVPITSADPPKPDKCC